MSVLERAKAALWAKSGLPHDHNGYVSDVHRNLLSGVPPESFWADFNEGSGQELQRKARALHSSSVLVVNTFGPWKDEPHKLTIKEHSNFKCLGFEAKCPTGLSGAPPNLDVLLQSSDTVLGIESKFLEPLTPTRPHFPDSYTRESLPQCEDAWWEILVRAPNMGFCHFDVAQIIKHYLGLRKQYSEDRSIYLLYLFWKPLNASDFVEYEKLEREIETFQSAVQPAKGVTFRSLDYIQLWNSWLEDTELAEHANRLIDRYCVKA